MNGETTGNFPDEQVHTDDLEPDLDNGNIFRDLAVSVDSGKVFLNQIHTEIRAHRGIRSTQNYLSDGLLAS